MEHASRAHRVSPPARQAAPLVASRSKSPRARITKSMSSPPRRRWGPR
ncbi:Hypothetical protein A7982_05564 [Minicystis rosea]|nr:Hypothetical protein A7982_05564 [Minicystis rosea]